VKHSLSRLLTVITGLLVIVLVSVFAIFARAAFDRQQDARRILAVVTVKRDMLSSQQSLRVEGGTLDLAMEESMPASKAMLDEVAALHVRTQKSFAHLEQHASNHLTTGYTEILEQYATYDRMLPAILDAAARPMDQRRERVVADRQRIVAALLRDMTHKSSSLSRSLSSADPMIYELLRINDVSWQARSDAGNDRHTLMAAILEGGMPAQQTLAEVAEMKGRVATSWAIVADDARLPEFPPALKAVVARANWLYFTEFMAHRTQVIQALSSGQPAPVSAEEWVRLSNRGVSSLMAVASTALDLTERYAAQQAIIAQRNFYIAIGLMLASLALAGFAAIYVLWRVIRPLRAITGSMRAIAGGDLKSEIPFSERKDEIGHFAIALKMFRDTSEARIRLERALVESRVAQETAETSNRVKSEFLSNMSHELRTPLNAIIGFSDIMQHQIHGPLPPGYDEYASLIHESGNLLLNLVSDILDLAKIEAGKFSLDLRDVDLEETVDYCLRLSQRRANECNITLVKTMAEGPLMFTADPRACKQILLNLVSNAVKFTRKGGTVEVTAAAIGDHVRIAVRDTGIGIPAHILTRIGGAFEQASNDPMLAREGTGLGLALVTALVAQHGGDLRIESKENVGTTVTVELPRCQAARVAA
jgi:signal transduction histidine kinase